MMTVKTALRLRSMEEISSPGVQNRCEAIRKQLGIHGKITLRYGDRAMIGGLLHPTLILPRELTGQRLTAAMTHELMHYKSGDLWIAAWWRVLCCIHWFNPVVWLCFFWARRDCERACDQRVLDSESVSPAVYAALLYEEATMKPKIRVGTTAFGGGGLKARIRGIADYHKSGMGMTVLAVALSYFAATQAVDSDSEYIELMPEQVMEMAQIAFPELEITQPVMLPGIPGYILEDGTVPPVELNNGNYRFVRRNIAYTMETKQLPAEDDTYQVLVTLNDAQGNSVGQWDVSLDSLGMIHSMKAI